MLAKLHPAIWMGEDKSGVPIKAVVRNAQAGTELEARYQAFRYDENIGEPTRDYMPLCPPCPVGKAYDKAKQVLLGNKQVIADARTLYALSAVLIGLLNHGKYAGLFRKAENAP